MTCKTQPTWHALLQCVDTCQCQVPLCTSIAHGRCHTINPPPPGPYYSSSTQLSPFTHLWPPCAAVGPQQQQAVGQCPHQQGCGAVRNTGYVLSLTSPRQLHHLQGVVRRWWGAQGGRQQWVKSSHKQEYLHQSFFRTDVEGGARQAAN